jgi:SsrA-binding protein
VFAAAGTLLGVMATDRSGTKLIASNRKARHDYAITDSIECGIVLQGSEVKSLRQGHVQIADAYARIVGGEVWLDGVHIPPYQFAHGVGAHDPDRPRKLLLHGNEVSRLQSEVAKERLSMVPLAFYFRDGKVKVELGVGKGRRKSDKRNAMAERDSQREMARAMGRQAKGMN